MAKGSKSSKKPAKKPPFGKSPAAAAGRGNSMLPPQFVKGGKAGKKGY